LEVVSKWNEIKKYAAYPSKKPYEKGKIYDLNCCACGKAIKRDFVPPKPYCPEHLKIYRNR